MANTYLRPGCHVHIAPACDIDHVERRLHVFAMSFVCVIACTSSLDARQRRDRSAIHLGLRDGTQLEAAVVIEEPGFGQFQLTAPEKMLARFGKRRGVAQ